MDSAPNMCCAVSAKRALVRPAKPASLRGHTCRNLDWLGVAERRSGTRWAFRWSDQAAYRWHQESLAQSHAKALRLTPLLGCNAD